MVKLETILGLGNLYRF